jgi:hypothetical protein
MRRADQFRAARGDAGDDLNNHKNPRNPGLSRLCLSARRRANIALITRRACVRRDEWSVNSFGGGRRSMRFPGPPRAPRPDILLALDASSSARRTSRSGAAGGVGGRGPEAYPTHAHFTLDFLTRGSSERGQGCLQKVCRRRRRAGGGARG